MSIVGLLKLSKWFTSSQIGPVNFKSCLCYLFDNIPLKSVAIWKNEEYQDKDKKNS